MYRFFLFVKGYYLITVEGLLAERFINLCKVKNIYLWDLQNSNNIYRMKISLEDYNILDDIMNKTGVKVDILEKYGLPFLFLGKKNRIFYLYFVLLALMLVFVSNLFVWKIDFVGNYAITDEQLKDFLYEYEIKEGRLKKKIPYLQLKDDLRKEFDMIKWCSVALDGNTLVIQIEENTVHKEASNEYVSDNYSDIVSAVDGVVKNILVRNGLSKVNVGDTVTKGQILVTGEVPIYDDSLQIKQYHYYDADADILIETNVNYEEILDDIYYEKEYTGRKKVVSYVKIKDKAFHLPINSQFAYYDIVTNINPFKLFGKIDTFIYYGDYEIREYMLIEKKYAKEDVVKIFNENLSNYYRSLSEKGVQILEKNVKIEYNANKWVLKGSFVVSFYNSEKEYKEVQVENIIQ